MNIQERIRQIMFSEELSDSEKLDRLHALIPPESFKIDNLNQATPEQLKHLKDGLAITEAMQQIRRQIAGSPHQTSWVDMMGYLSGRPRRFLHRPVGKFVVRTLSGVDVWSSLSPLYYAG